MKILMVHNYYQQPGGEDTVFQNETQLLLAKGHDVIQYHVSNDRIHQMGQVNVAIKTLWNQEISADLGKYIDQHKPDLVHFHNTFPLISPAAYYLVSSKGIPVVQTLHNYRLLCLNSYLFRDGQICSDCVSKLIPYPGVRHRCYRDNFGASTTVAAFITFHRILQTWKNKVDAYIALTEFQRGILVDGGLPAEKIHIKPNFITPDPGPGNHTDNAFLYVGRLSKEKGIETLLSVMDILPENYRFLIAGDGPLAPQVTEKATQLSNVEYLGPLDHDQVIKLMQDSNALIIPSLWYEGFPMVVVEAFSVGLPILGSNLGNTGSLIHDCYNGLLFVPGDANSLANSISEFILNRTNIDFWQNARKTFLENFTAEISYQKLISIYQRVVASKLPSVV